ncbi:transglycosylase family protein [Streptomyces sp. LaPpAH-108]|uniref:LysM peptidoglycan-binding domain-containing protein n=1 Tax=Streptomyces sp. LaPpAH-108 TaxID=1155714 RepID=UPI00036DE598|nr:transglycosylase family protein [Streptomyces sp. LaPpAH-108]
MLSGNGRHRRPRQAPALLVAAGVTTSAIAIPLLGAASAHAADGTTWDKVAECESGGSWSANTGNGYYGGLQISQEDWDKYGGNQYAATADLASRSQQISVAEKILAEQGTTHWATCALTAGLTSDSASVNVDTGVADTASPSAGSSDGKGKDSASPSASESAGKSGSSDSAEPSDSPSASASDDSSADASAKPSKGKDKDADAKGSGKDKDATSGASASGGDAGTSGDYSAPASEESDDAWQDGGSWSLVDTGALTGGGRHRGGSADESVTSGQKADNSGRHALPSATTYTIHEGDTLESIADSLGVDGGWQALYSANKKTIGGDPDALVLGQKLKVPGGAEGK